MRIVYDRRYGSFNEIGSRVLQLKALEPDPDKTLISSYRNLIKL